MQCFDNESTNLPRFGNSSAVACTLHPEPIVIHGVHVNPSSAASRFISSLYTPERAEDLPVPLRFLPQYGCAFEILFIIV